MAAHLVIAAIDFGTTYSGYAYAFRRELGQSNVKIPIHAQMWTNELANIKTDKTPTSILFTPDGTFDSFGYEAEKRYAELADDDEHEDWKLFKHFKMELHQSKIGENTRIKDDLGKSMLALDVFAAAIRYLKESLIESLKAKVDKLKESDVDWVITVPAIWTYKAKQFMKVAAIKAGLCPTQTVLAHEPEAAAIYCKHFEVNLESDIKGNSKLSRFEQGSQFMVLDLGGGTVDITACEVQYDETLKELCPRGGGPWGGIVVNAKLCELFDNLFGEDLMADFARENKYDHLRLLETIEFKKRLTGKPSSTASKKSYASVQICLPLSFLEIYERKHKVKLEKALSNQDQYPSVKREKLCFSKSDFEEAFQESIGMLVKEVKRLISKNNLKKLNTFMMVGGFAESTIMQKAVKLAFPEKRLIIPDDTSTVILKGAVLYGFRNAFIQSRKLPYTFGISTAEDFNPQRHPPERRPRHGKVEDIFCPFIRKGTEVTADGKTVEKMFGEGNGNAIEIYQTSADDLDDIVFTSDESLEFERIGTVRFRSCESKVVDVKMTFGIFDIEVANRAHGSKEWTTATFDAL